MRSLATSPHQRTATLPALLIAVSLAAPVAAQPLAYVLAQRDDDPGSGTNGIQTLVVIDTATNSVTATVPLGLSCYYCFTADTLALAPDGSRVFVANQVAGTVSVVDAATNAVLAHVPVGGAPNALAPSPDGTRLYVVRGVSLVVIDLDLLVPIRTITLPGFAATRGIAVTPDGARLYVGNFGFAQLMAVDTTTGAVQVMSLPDRPLELELAPDGSVLYVTAGDTNRVFVVDTVTHRLRTSVTIGPGDQYPQGLRLTPDGGRVYTANLRGYTVSAIDRSTHTVAATVAVPNPRGLDFSPDGSRGFITSLYGVTLLDMQSHAVTGLIPFDLGMGAPTAIEVADPAPDPPHAAIDLVAVSVVGNQVTLRWTPPASGPRPTNHRIEGGVDRGSVQGTLRTGSAHPIVTFTAPSGAFYVRVRGLNGPSLGAASNEIRIFVDVPQAPSAPAGFSGAVNGTSVALSWRNTYAGGAPSSLALDVTGAVTTTLPLGLTDAIAFTDVPAGTYTLRLRALNAGGSSPASTPVTLSIPGACSGVPEPPADFLTSRTGNTISVTWNPAPSGPATTGYVLRVSGAFTATMPTMARQLSGAVGPGTYTLSVAGTNICGEGVATAAQVVTVP